MKSTLAKNPGQRREWVIVDAKDRPLGRLAVEVALLLRGKDRADYTPNVDMGAFVIVTNAAKVRLTGRKEDQKEYQDYTGHWSGLKKTTAREMRERNPEEMVKRAVRRMLPKNQLARRYFRRLKVYAGDQQPHAAQQPKSRAAK